MVISEKVRKLRTDVGECDDEDTHRGKWEAKWEALMLVFVLLFWLGVAVCFAGMGLGFISMMAGDLFGKEWEFIERPTVRYSTHYCCCRWHHCRH